MKGETYNKNTIFWYLNCFIDMQETMSEFKEYFEDEIDDGTKEAYNKALEKLEKLMPYEEALVSVLKYPYMYEVTGNV